MADANAILREILKSNLSGKGAAPVKPSPRPK